MKILITGATGFVGTTLLHELLKNHEYEVSLLVRRNIEIKGVTNIIDISKDNWTKKVESLNPEIIIHLAALFSNRSDLSQIKDLVESNILFTAQLAEVASRCTACKAFLNTGTFTEFISNTEELMPNNLYSATKSAVRPILQYYSEKAGWKWINVIVYSPYGRKNRTKKVIDYLLDALGSETPIAFSPGEQILDFIHVDDMARFYIALLAQLDRIPKGFTQLYLGTGEGHNLREIGNLLEKLSGKKLNANWGGRPYSPEDPMYAVAPIEKNFPFIDWQPQESLESGMNILLKDVGII